MESLSDLQLQLHIPTWTSLQSAPPSPAQINSANQVCQQSAQCTYFWWSESSKKFILTIPQMEKLSRDSKSVHSFIKLKKSVKKSQTEGTYRHFSTELCKNGWTNTWTVWPSNARSPESKDWPSTSFVAVVYTSKYLISWAEVLAYIYNWVVEGVIQRIHLSVPLKTAK